MDIFSTIHRMLCCSKGAIRSGSLLALIFVCRGVSAQYQNPDAITLFDRSTVGGSAATAGSGGAYSSVGGDLGSMELNPAGLGLFKGSDICITPGIRVAHDQSAYDGSSANTNHTIAEFAQAGAVFTKKLGGTSDDGMGQGYNLKSIPFGINYQTDNSFDRNQSFSYTNTSHSLVNNYVNQANQGIYYPDLGLMLPAGIVGQNQVTGSFYPNVKAPVNQSGYVNTRGGTDNISLGLGGNLGDKIYFGISLGIPVLNYSVYGQATETNANGNDTVTHFQGYQLNSHISETGVGVTGKLGLIFKPVSWARFGISYSLPTWYFLNENYNSSLVYSFDTSSFGTQEIDGAINALSYRVRTPMKGTLGASFYLNENSFISADYEFQNIGATHYSFSNDSAGLQASETNGYIKGTYTYSHTLRAGLQGAIKKLRLRAGYAYTNSPFKSGQNYTASQYNQAIQTATFGVGLKFKVIYLDLAYVFTYSRDGISPGYIIPLDQINSTYMTHSVLFTLGFKIPSKGDNSSPAKQQRQRSSDQLPKYIDPGDNKY